MIEKFQEIPYPILIGASRKSMIGNFLNISNPNDRIFGTIAITALASLKRVDFIRVHDVLPNIQCSKIVDFCR